MITIWSVNPNADLSKLINLFKRTLIFKAAKQEKESTSNNATSVVSLDTIS